MFFTADKIATRFVIKATSKMSDNDFKFFEKYTEKKYGARVCYYDKSMIEVLEDFNSVKTYASEKWALKAIERYKLENDKVTLSVVEIGSLGYLPAQAK